jgi:hypothetical protein
LTALGSALLFWSGGCSQSADSKEATAQINQASSLAAEAALFAELKADTQHFSRQFANTHNAYLQMKTAEIQEKAEKSRPQATTDRLKQNLNRLQEGLRELTTASDPARLDRLHLDFLAIKGSLEELKQSR